MNASGRIIGHLFFMALFATVSSALPAASANDVAPNDVAPTMAAAQMLDLANRELASSHLSATDRARNLIARGLAHEMLGERGDALPDFNEAISASVLSSQEQAGALYDRGVTLDELGRTDDAISDYTAALKLQPDFAAALNNRGNALRRLGRLEEARGDYEASMRAGNPHPEYPEYGMGQIAEALGQPNAALEYYRSALAANPQFTLAEERLVAMDAGATRAATGPEQGMRRPIHRAARHLRPTAPAIVADAGAVLKPAITDAPDQPGRSIQLGSYRSRAEASDAWNHAQSSVGELLAGLAPSIVAVDLPAKGRYYRLRAGQLEPGVAAHLCALLKARGNGCLLPPH
jgi:tetratricopeptide (TPR) repeat protein